MDKTQTILKHVKHSLNLKQLDFNKNCSSIVTARNYCKDSKEVQNVEEKRLAAEKKYSEISKPSYLPPSIIGRKVWDEISALKKLKKQSKFYRADNATDCLEGLQKTQNYPTRLSEIPFFLKQRYAKKQLLYQKFLPERHEILKPDLAAAHFLGARKGSVKFLGQNFWVGVSETKKELPFSYVPGLFIECINAEKTDLYFEGLKNLCDLKYLNWLSLKGLEQVNDWWLDWISNEYCTQLSYLDISGCKHVSYRGLSCFYRFENLKTLIVENVSDSPEFKLALLMVQDILPDLEILGIDLTPPKEIESLEADVKQIPDNQTSLTKE